MTEKKAKELTIEVWTYFAEHPEITKKSELPEELYIKIKDLRSKCPLCELFRKWKKNACHCCPLYIAGHFCESLDSFYYLWIEAKTKGERSAAAWGIVNITKEWKI
jgi:hypothetical protein